MGEPRLPGESGAAATSAAAVVLLCRDLCFPVGGTRLAHPAPLWDFISESQPNEAVSMETVALVPVATIWGFTRAEGRGTTVTSADGLILPGATSRRPRGPVGIGRSWGPGGLGVPEVRGAGAGPLQAGSGGCHHLCWCRQPLLVRRLGAEAGDAGLLLVGEPAALSFPAFLGSPSSRQLGLSWGKRFLQMLGFKQIARRT